jgi:hypothetical protein
MGGSHLDVHSKLNRESAIRLCWIGGLPPLQNPKIELLPVWPLPDAKARSKTSLLPGFGFSLGFRFSLFRSERPYRIGAHRAKCRKIQSDQ